MTRFPFRVLIVLVLTLSLISCAKSNSGGPRKGLRNVRASTQTGSNFKRSTVIPSDDEETKPKEKKSKRKASDEDRDFTPRGGFR